MIKPPCYGCNDRSAECHGICEKYKEYVKEKAADNEVRKKLKNEKDMIYLDAKGRFQRMKQAKISWREKGCVK